MRGRTSGTPPSPVSAAQMRFDRAAEVWAAISISALLVGLAVLILVVARQGLGGARRHRGRLRHRRVRAPGHVRPDRQPGRRHPRADRHRRSARPLLGARVRRAPRRARRRSSSTSGSVSSDPDAAERGRSPRRGGPTSTRRLRAGRRRAARPTCSSWSRRWPGSASSSSPTLPATSSEPSRRSSGASRTGSIRSGDSSSTSSPCGRSSWSSSSASAVASGCVAGRRRRSPSPPRSRSCRPGSRSATGPTSAARSSAARTRRPFPSRAWPRRARSC